MTAEHAFYGFMLVGLLGAPAAAGVRLTKEIQMKRLFLLCVITIFSIPAMSYAQKTDYIFKKDVFTWIVSIRSNVNHADNILNMKDTIPWVEAMRIVSYRYMGVDSGHNLHIMRTEGDDVSNLIFYLDADNSGEITLIGQISQKEPLPIKLRVKATNNGINIKYLGDLPVYTEK